MIGTNIRSVRHLFRVSDTSLKTIMINIKEGIWDVCKVIKMPKDSSFGETLIIFNNVTNQSSWSLNTILGSNDFKKYCKIDDISGYCRVISIQYSDIRSFDNYFLEITLLPSTFEKDYEKFLKENSKMFNSLLDKYGFNPREPRIKRLYTYTDGSKNFFQWGVNQYFGNRVGMSTIKSILIWNDSYKQLAKNLSKGTITAYTSKDSIAVLLNELTELRKEKRINDSINSFNTLQKKMLKEHELSEDIKQALWRLSRLSDTKRINFVKKMSSVEDFNELTRQLKFVTSVHFSWSKESFMDFLSNVEGIKYEKIFENENVVLVKVLDYETIKQLGKTTNWCISKNKQYWNNYIEHNGGLATQYMVFDFSKLEDDKLSIIGFTTTHNKGITSAHNFINDNLMGSDEGNQIRLESFLSAFEQNKNIYSILSDDGIDITLVIQYDTPSYEWNKESMLSYLYECVDYDNVDVLCDKNNKLVLSVTDSHVRYFFGDAYSDNMCSEYYSYQHIIFADFNKSKYDITKLQFAIIEDGCGDEDYCIAMYNERSMQTNANFEALLIEFGLPYDTIRRTNDIRVRLRNAICSFNTPMINACMKECDTKMLRSVIKENIGNDQMYDLVASSIRHYLSFDYINLFYDNGLNMHEFIGWNYVAELIKQLLYDMRCTSRATDNFKNLKRVNDTDIENFFNHNLGRREDTKYVGLFVAFKKILSHELVDDKLSNNDLCRRFIMFINSECKHGEIYDDVISLVLDRISYESNSEMLQCLVKYTIYFGTDELKKYIYDKANDSAQLKHNIKTFEAKYKEFLEYNARKEKAKKAEELMGEPVFINPFHM